MAVGIIIPAYNSEKYIDQCINSVVNQSYNDLEILIILGQSSDNTDDIARAWQEKDSRITVMHQSTGRLGSARNEAIATIRSEMVAFVDADDWIDSQFVEKMLDEMENNNRDLVICNRANVVFGADGLAEKVRPIKMVGMEDDADSINVNPELIRSIEVSVNGKLYKKDLFTKHNIIQPDVFGEDRAIIPYLTTKCKSIGRVKDILYYYRAEHGTNSVSSVKTYFSAADCMEYIKAEFERDNINERFHAQLNSVYSAIAGVSKRYLRSASDDESVQAIEAEDRIRQFIRDNEVEKVRKRYTWGSYSLRRMTQFAFPQSEEMRESYSYSSIISGMSKEPLAIEKIRDYSTDQMKWFYYDYYKIFRNEFFPDEKDILLIDFLDERFPVYMIDNMFFTYSPYAQRQHKIHAFLTNNGSLLSDAERDEMWMESCDRFTQLLMNRMDSNRIILVRNYLTSEYGKINDRKAFFDHDVIKKINHKLEQYYEFFINLIPDISVVNTAQKDPHYFYSDVDFDFECRPWHYNDNYYMRQGTECFMITKGKL